MYTYVQLFMFVSALSACCVLTLVSDDDGCFRVSGWVYSHDTVLFDDKQNEEQKQN